MENKLEPEKKIEERLVNQFMEEFFEKLGYYPTVITKYNTKSYKYRVLSLEELEKHFDEYLPTIYSKKHSLRSKNRSRYLVDLRFIFYFIARSMGYGLAEIAKHLEFKDHSTVIHAIKQFRCLMETDVKFKNKYMSIINNIKLKTNEPSALESIN